MQVSSVCPWVGYATANITHHLNLLHAIYGRPSSTVDPLKNSQAVKKVEQPLKAWVKKVVKSKVAAMKWLQ